jgi:cupin 2 domain-containing protein
MMINNILAETEIPLGSELIETLLKSDSVVIERIVSNASVSMDGFWYDQDTDEFVLLLKGSAVLEFENESPIALEPGSCLLIEAHKRHRVARTHKSEKTIWLTVHFGGK